MGIKCVCDTFLHATASTISANSFRFLFRLLLSADAVSVVALLTFSKTGTSSMAAAAAAVAAVVWWLLLLFLAVLFHIRSAGYDRIVSLTLYLCGVNRLNRDVLRLTAFTAECNGTENGKNFRSTNKICFSFHFAFPVLCGAPFSLFSFFLPRFILFGYFCGAFANDMFRNRNFHRLLQQPHRAEMEYDAVTRHSLTQCRWMAITFTRRRQAHHIAKRTSRCYCWNIQMCGTRKLMQSLGSIHADAPAPAPARIHPHKFQFGAVQINY